MQLSLTKRFVLTLSVLAIALIVLPALAIRWSVQQELFDYLQRRESARLQPLKETLQSAWAEQGDWQFLQDNPAALTALIEASGVNERRPRWQRGAFPPPEMLPMHAERMPPPRDAGPAGDAGPPDERKHGPDLRLEVGSRREPVPLSQRLQVFDANEQMVVGVFPDGTTITARQPLEHAGRLIGYLQWQTPPLPSDGLEQRFLRGQQQTLLLITGAAILLALAVAAWLARGLTRPMLSLAGTVRQLANGELDARTTIAGNRKFRRDELGELARDVDKLAMTLTANEKMRRELMADVSHEFRTPLSLMQGKIEAMQDGILPSDAATLSSLHDATLRLSRLVDDLHQLALADTGALSLRREPVDLRSLLDAAAADWAERFAAAKLTLRVSGELHAMAVVDRQRIRQIVDNLLHNSLRYTDAGGETLLQVHTEPETVVMRIEDSAPGVAEADLDRLFDRFYRVERSRNRSAGGSGLGLGVVKALVQAHGGQMRATASALGGLAVTIVLPVGTPDGAAK